MKMQAKLKDYIFSFISEYKTYLLALIIIAAAAAFFQISVDYKIKEIIDAIAQDKDVHLTFLLGLFVLYKFLYHGAFFLSILLDIKYKPMIVEHTITQMYKKTVNHSLHWFDSHMSGEISNKISNFQEGITEVITNCFRVFNTVATIVLSLCFLATLNFFTALVLIAFILIYIPVIYSLTKKQLKLQGAYVSARQNAIGIVNDSISNIFGIKIIGNLANEFRLKLKPAIARWKHLDKETRKFDAFFIDNADTIMITLMSAVQIYLLAYLYQTGQVTAGGFTFIAIITLKIHNQLDMLLDSLLFHINPSIAKVRSSYEFINAPIDVKDKEDAKKLDVVKGEIKYSDVGFTYDRRGKNVLQNFNLHIKPGERVGIVGTSGAGKTTLVKCLLRYFDINSGSIYIDGNDIRDVTQKSLRANFSIIPQDITMFHRSIRENLKLAKYDATDEQIISACKKAKIHSAILEMPDGYDTIVGERGVKLSGGQRQRIAIARAILKNAPIIILDEATSSLDTPTETLVQESLNDEILENGKSTVIAIAHRLSTLKHMDRIIVLSEGKIVEEGTHHGLIRKQNGFYKKLWDMQAI